MRLDLSSSLWGVRIREIREACFYLHKVGAQVGNPLQCYRSAEEGTTALRAALAVVEHNRPGFERHRQQSHWQRLTAQAHEAALNPEVVGSIPAKTQKLRAQIYIYLNNNDPQARVLNYCFKI